ncbi:MAG: hypothetical protein JEZ03_09035 [Bacteroidales bacterium]|nr:hypothetical protein [Bacteroidales bacterium]
MKSIFLLILFLPTICLGQLIRSSEKVLDINFNVDKIVSVQDTAYILIHNKQTGVIKYDNPVGGGVESESFSTILRPTWRSDIGLPENEAFFGIYNLLLYTIKYNYSEGWFEIKSYDLNSDDFDFKKSYKNEVYWLPIFVGDGTILLSDNMDTDGKFIQLLNSEMELVLKLESSGYYRNVQITHDNAFYYLIADLVNIDRGKFNFIKVKKLNGNIIINKDFDLSINTVSCIKANGNVVACLGEGTINLIDNSGNLLWVNEEFILPRQDFCFVDDYLYLTNDKDLLVLSIEDGAIIDKISLTEYYKENLTLKKKAENVINRVLFLEPFRNESVFLMMGQSEKGFHIDEKSKYNSQFFIINKSGVIEFQSELFSETTILLPKVKKRDLDLIIHNKIINYEE